MRVISQAKLKTFYAKHSNTEQALRAWYDEAKKARWETPQQIKDNHPANTVRLQLRATALVR
jgi:mRNA interferase HigB